MSDLLPIETGCKAIIIGSFFHDNNGLEVTVGNFLGRIPKHHDSDNNIIWGDKDPTYWQIDIQKKAGDREHVYYEEVIPERMLMRIDGYKETEQDKQEELAHG